MTFISRSHSGATPNLSSTILPDLRQATRSNSRKSCRLWRWKQSRLNSTISCMLFGRFLYLNVHTSHWWAVRGGRFCVVLNNTRPLLPLETEFFETARAGKGFYRPIAKVPKLTFYSARHPYLYQVRWSDDSDIWHWWRWRCQSPKCGGTGGKEVQKTIVRICLSTTCRCLLWRQVPVNLLPSVM